MSMFDATTKEGRARIRSDMHARTWPLGGTPFTNGQGIERLLDACKALEKEVAGRRSAAPARMWTAAFARRPWTGIMGLSRGQGGSTTATICQCPAWR